MTASVRSIASVPAPAPAPAPVPVLGALTNLLNRLHAARIVYCHWKSNEHLAASLSGDTDLDLLVDRADGHALATVLNQAGFKHFSPLPGRGYAGIDDWIGLDAETGRLLHAHVHYQLTVGEPFLKGFRLPWESEVLATRQWDERHGMYVADPHVELILLVVRAVLKIRRRDQYSALLGRSYTRDGTLREFRWLTPRVSLERLAAVGATLLGAAAVPTLVALVQDDALSLNRLLALRARAQPPLSAYRLHHPVSALARRWWNELQSRAERVMRRLIRRPWARPRLPPSGGLSVAFVGGDGAGKSTLARTVGDWLSRHAVVMSFYGGSGTGPGSLPRRALEALRRLVTVPRPSRARADNPVRAARSPGVVRGIWRGLWSLALASERNRRVRVAYRARSRGMIVVWDRFPQTQVPGVQDGPQLSHWRSARFPLARWAARRELALLRAADLYSPDLVIKLHVSYAVARERKPDTPPDRLREKLAVTRRLRYAGAARVVEVDADRPAEQVLRDVQRAIWEAL